MATNNFTAGAHLFRENQNFGGLFMIADGAVRLQYSDYSILLGKGDIIGALSVFSDAYCADYYAETAISLIPYSFRSENSASILAANLDLANQLLFSQVKQLTLLIRLFNEQKDLIDAVDLPNLPQWLTAYYHDLHQLQVSMKKLPAALCVGLLEAGCHKADEILTAFSGLTETAAATNVSNDEMLLNEMSLGEISLGEMSLGDLNSDLFSDDDIDLDELNSDVFGKPEILADAEESSDIEIHIDSNADIPDFLSGSLLKLLDYAHIDKSDAKHFVSLIEQYLALPNKNSTEKPHQMLRAEITTDFFKIYQSVFFASLKDNNIPPVVTMFLNFGYMDERLAGTKSTLYLYELSKHLPSSPENGVYTIYEWLCAVYRGEKETSRNEFDLDFPAALHEKKVRGEITEKQEKELLQDATKMVEFEIENLFKTVNKITFGHISIYCPVFSEHNVLTDLNTSLVSTNRISDCINKIAKIDFGAFARESLYSNEKLGITKEYVQVDVRPNFILMPNVGARPVMWQEIEGRKRTTPARFALPIFYADKLYPAIIHLVGDYRWEMCKRQQGGRWNDVTDPSLTSEYFDYIQFYRKNHDLSTEVKERIKASLQRCRNSFKEVFVQDYMQWIMFESEGNPRLNKVARRILFTYCPFPSEIRRSLIANPLYKETMERYEIKKMQKLKHIDSVIYKLDMSGAKIPPELSFHKAFLSK